MIDSRRPLALLCCILSWVAMTKGGAAALIPEMMRRGYSGGLAPAIAAVPVLIGMRGDTEWRPGMARRISARPA